MNTVKFILLSGLGLFLVGNLSATSFWDGTTGDWSDVSKWSNGIPGPSPADTDARNNAGGTVTVQPGTTVDTTGTVAVRVNWGNLPNPSAIVWNPGVGSPAQFINRVEMANDQATAGATFDHQSGSLRLAAGWFHVGRRGDATYLGSNDSELIADDRVSFGEGANNHNTDIYVELNDNAIVRTRRGATSLDPADAQGNSGNESFISGHGGNDTRVQVTMNDNSMMESQAWRIARNGSVATIDMNNFSQLRNRNNNQINLGQSGAATINVNHNAQIMLLGGGGGSLRVGDNNNGVGVLNLNNNGKVIGVNGTSHHVVVGDDGNSQGTVVMNDNSGFERVRNVWIGNGGSSDGTVIMNDNSFIDNTGGGGDAIRIAQSSTADGTLIMNDNSTITTRNFGIDQGNSGGTGTVIQNHFSTVTTTSGWMEIGGGNNDTSTYTMNDNSRLDAQGWLVAGQRTNGRGELYLNGNAAIDNAQIGGGFIVGNVAGSDGYLEINDDGSIIARNFFLMANNNNSNGEVNQNDPGTSVQVNNFLRLGRNGVTGNSATYNLDGGILRVNDVRVEDGGNFNWGAGTITMTEVNANNNIVFTGDLTTGHAGDVNAASTLDLGDLYKDNGLKFDTLTVSGAVDLNSNADVLDFWDNINHLRPAGGQILTGEIRLVTAVGGLTGEFENILGPDGGATFFRTWSPAEAATLGITGAGDLTRNRGAIVYRGDGVYFAYNVSGQIPEPATGIFLLLGTGLLRGISVFRRNQRMRGMLKQIA